jgi:hypothetical protein
MLVNVSVTFTVESENVASGWDKVDQWLDHKGISYNIVFAEEY